MATYIAVRVDEENNAEKWWDAIRERYPCFTTSLARNEAAVIAAYLWNTLATLPGFSDGPEYAKCALIDCGDEGDLYNDVVKKKHDVFDELL